MRGVEDVVREIMEDTRFKGQQHYRFQEKLDDNSQVVEANGCFEERQVLELPFM